MATTIYVHFGLNHLSQPSPNPLRRSESKRSLTCDNYLPKPNKAIANWVQRHACAEWWAVHQKNGRLRRR